MNGTVAPPSSSATAAVTWASRTPSSSAMRLSIDVMGTRRFEGARLLARRPRAGQSLSDARRPQALELGLPAHPRRRRGLVPRIARGAATSTARSVTGRLRRATLVGNLLPPVAPPPLELHQGPR